ncbi:hypothetical protein O4220_13405 [Rhodococcus ruber]|uniref:Uncharacterized protein n=1 Tax=Rhodococcus ruber TaxID=1830 RepID=A0ABT4MFB2_9NOCA|nr:hypothetical protein [Rhodococcus ruber]MCZ4519513.1 hypothetical protein [Rhodococcus ruber]
MTIGNESGEEVYDPEIITSLLQRFNWHLDSLASDTLQVWRNESLSDQEILFPIDHTKGDYVQLLRRAYRALRYEHGQEVESVNALMTVQHRSMLEATRWEKETAVTPGLIGWRLGEALFSVARETLMAAAKASKEPRRYFGNSSPYIAKRFMDETLMGQTEIGSFVVTAYTPSGKRFYYSKASEESSSSKLINVESRSGAEIIQKFEDVISATRDKLDEYKRDPRDVIFEDLIETGFSHEMSHALASLTDNGDGAVTISRPGLGRQLDRVTEIAFDSVESPILARIADQLRITAEPETVNLVGEVTLLDHVSTLESHTIRLHVSNRPGTRIVRINLDPDQYKVAIEAHRNDTPLRVTGTLTKEGKYNWLLGPANVSSIVGASNDDDDDNDNDDDGQDTQEPLF